MTIDWLRNRLTELETSVKECQEKQSKLQMENGTSLPIPKPSPLTNGNGRKENNKYVMRNIHFYVHIYDLSIHSFFYVIKTKQKHERFYIVTMP